MLLLLIDNDQQARDESFLQISETEAVGDARNGRTHPFWELNGLITRQPLSPEFAIATPFRQSREIEMIFAVEATGPFRDARVQFLEIIRGSDHHETFVAFQAVDLIEEETAGFVGDETVKVFEDEETGCRFAGLFEDVADGPDGAVVSFSGFDVEGWDRGGLA